MKGEKTVANKQAPEDSKEVQACNDDIGAIKEMPRSLLRRVGDQHVGYNEEYTQDNAKNDDREVVEAYFFFNGKNKGYNV